MFSFRFLFYEWKILKPLKRNFTCSMSSQYWSVWRLLFIFTSINSLKTRERRKNWWKIQDENRRHHVSFQTTKCRKLKNIQFRDWCFDTIQSSEREILSKAIFNNICFSDGMYPGLLLSALRNSETASYILQVFFHTSFLSSSSHKVEWRLYRDS